MYDVTNRESFDALDAWMDEIKKDIGGSADLQRVVFAVCANKVQLDHTVQCFRMLL